MDIAMPSYLYFIIADNIAPDQTSLLCSLVRSYSLSADKSILNPTSHNINCAVWSEATLSPICHKDLFQMAQAHLLISACN